MYYPPRQIRNVLVRLCSNELEGHRSFFRDNTSFFLFSLAVVIASTNHASDRLRILESCNVWIKHHIPRGVSRRCLYIVDSQ